MFSVLHASPTFWVTVGFKNKKKMKKMLKVKKLKPSIALTEWPQSTRKKIPGVFQAFPEPQTYFSIGYRNKKVTGQLATTNSA